MAKAEAGVHYPKGGGRKGRLNFKTAIPHPPHAKDPKADALSAEGIAGLANVRIEEKEMATADLSLT